MRVNNKKQDPVRLHHENIKEVNKFVYLGSVVSKDGGADEDINYRIRKHGKPSTPYGQSEDPTLQHQRQIDPTLRLRNLASNKDQHPQTPYIYQQMSQEHPQHQVAGGHPK